MQIKKLDITDYKNVLAFYKTQIDFLERKEFFYPYQDSDLNNLLNNGGIMLGAFDNGNIIGLSAVDYDQNYSKILKELVNTFFPYADKDTAVCEYSGVMTHKDYRNKGVAAKLYEQLLTVIKKDIVLCAVVQLENQASLSFFFKRGFRLVYVKRDFEIDFGYLIKYLDKELETQENTCQYINCLDYKAYYKLLKQGFVGTQFYNSKIKMCRITSIRQ